jgi:hypothetical protein
VPNQHSKTRLSLLDLRSVHQAVRPSLHLDQQLRGEEQHRTLHGLPALPHPLPRLPRTHLLPRRSQHLHRQARAVLHLVHLPRRLQDGVRPDSGDLPARPHPPLLPLHLPHPRPLPGADKEPAEEQDDLRDVPQSCGGAQPDERPDSEVRQPGVAAEL